MSQAALIAVLAVLLQAMLLVAGQQDATQAADLIESGKFENSQEKLVVEKLFTKWVDKSSGILSKLTNKVLPNESERRDLLKLLDAARQTYSSGQMDEQTRAAAAETEIDLPLMIELINQIEIYLNSDESYRRHLCDTKVAAKNLTTLLQLFAFNRDGKLFRYLHDRALEMYESCKPIWDGQFLAEVDTRLDQATRKRMSELFDNVVAADDRIKQTYINDHSPTDDERISFGTQRMFQQLFDEPPKPTSVLLFMLRYFEREFNLDENMKNPKMSGQIFEKSINKLVVPLCLKVHQELGSTTAFYLNYLYRNKWLDKRDAYVRLFQGNAENKDRVNKWLVSDSICQHLTNNKEADRIYTQVFKEITSNHQPGSETAGTQNNKSQTQDSYPERVFESLDDEFRKNRRKLFLRENGFKAEQR